MEFLNIINVKYLKKRTDITVFVDKKYLTTHNFRDFSETILARLPGIKLHHCKNNLNIPVEEELKNTETAHALEHILIEVIFQADPNAERLAGVTAWNWHRQPTGTYLVSLRYTNRDFLEPALEESLNILNNSIQEYPALDVAPAFSLLNN